MKQIRFRMTPPQMPPAEFGALVQAELAKWVSSVRSSGAKVD
jgi:hypothetical protein